MRKTVLLTFVLCLVAALAVAQQEQNPPAPSTASPGQESAPKASPEENAIEGCLGGTAGNYTVTDKSGMVYKLELPDDAPQSAIEKLVGKEVRVKGTLAEASASPSGPEPDSGASKEPSEKAAPKSQTLKATSMEKLGDTCSAKGETSEKK